MPTYKYEALNAKGRTIKGTMTAVNEIDLENKLHTIGLDLINSAEANELRFNFFETIGIKDLILLCIHLEQLDKAGVPILDSLSDLRDTTESNKLKNIMTDICELVESGKMLSAAFANYPEVFDEIFVGLVAAGEKTGNLGDIFLHLSKHLKWVNDIRTKMRKAVSYPIFLLLLMAGIVTLMMFFVVPKLSEFLLAQNLELPIYTKALISFSGFFRNYWYLILTSPIILIASISFSTRINESFAYFIDNIKLSIPFIGNTIKKIELARFCRFFGITFRSGIGILECLEIAGNTVKNLILKESIILASKSVSEGNSLTASLKISNHFPNLVLRMVKVGEDSGNLDHTLENVNFFYDREVEDSVNNLLGVLQPALTIILGGIMLWVSLAVFGPLYNSFSSVGL